MQTESNKHGASGEAEFRIGSQAILDLLSAQIESALADLERPQSEVAKFFCKIVTEIERIESIFLDSGHDIIEFEAIAVILGSLKAGATKPIVEMQSFDRVEQRLRHVKESLHLIADHTNADNIQHYQYADEKVLESIKSTYSMKHELVLHNMMESGSSRNQLLNYSSFNESDSGSDDIDLF